MLKMLTMVKVACGQRYHSRYEISVAMKNRSIKSCSLVEEWVHFVEMLVSNFLILI